jgi:surface antigen
MRSVRQVIVSSSLLLLAASVAAGCAGPKATVGGLGGAAAGGAIGGAVGGAEGVILGGLVGGLFGAAVGTALDQRDRELATRTAAYSLEHMPSGRTNTWRNPDTGHRGSFTPLRTYERRGTYCREFQQTIVIDGQPRRAYGTACRQPDGAWEIQG